MSFTGVAPVFSDEDKAAESEAYNVMINIPKVSLMTEFQVLKSACVHICQIGRMLIHGPIAVLRVNDTPEYKHNLAIVISMTLAIGGMYALGLGFDSGLEFVRWQKLYKLWSLYSISQLLIAAGMKIQVHSHRMIRGAIRRKTSMILPVIIHTFSNLLLFASYSLANGTLLGGLYGKKKMVLSVCVRTYTLMLKKYLSGFFGITTVIDEPVSRLRVLFAVVSHLSQGNLADVRLLVEFEAVSMCLKFFLTAMTENSVEFYESLRASASSVAWEFLHNDVPFGESILAIFPVEVFGMIVISLILTGPALRSAILIAVVCITGMLGPIVIKALVSQKPDVVKVASASTMKKSKTK